MPKFEPFQIFASIVAAVILVTAILLHLSGKTVDDSILWLVGIGIVVGILPWLHSFGLNADGVHFTVRDAKENSAKIASNLHTNSEETKKALDGLQAQIDGLARATQNQQPGLLEQLASDRNIVAVASGVINVVSNASKDIYNSIVGSVQDNKQPSEPVISSDRAAENDKLVKQPSPHP
jgi:hypothetical protein